MSEKQNEKTYDISFFMPGQTIEAEEVEVPISKRFVDKQGGVGLAALAVGVSIKKLCMWRYESISEVFNVLFDC